MSVLPDLAWSQITSYLAVEDVYSLRQVNRRLSELTAVHVRNTWNEVVLDSLKKPKPVKQTTYVTCCSNLRRIAIFVSAEGIVKNWALWLLSNIKWKITAIWIGTNSKQIWEFLKNLSDYLLISGDAEQAAFPLLHTLHLRFDVYDEIVKEKNDASCEALCKAFAIFKHCTNIDAEILFIEHPQSRGRQLDIPGLSHCLRLKNTRMRVEFMFCSDNIGNQVDAVLSALDEGSAYILVEYLKITDRSPSISRSTDLRCINVYLTILTRALMKKGEKVEELRLSGIDLTQNGDFFSNNCPELCELLGDLTALRLSFCKLNINSLIQKLSTHTLQKIEFAGCLRDINNKQLSDEHIREMFNKDWCTSKEGTVEHVVKSNTWGKV